MYHEHLRFTSCCGVLFEDNRCAPQSEKKVFSIQI